jgi:hypothetical protein
VVPFDRIELEANIGSQLPDDLPVQVEHQPVLLADEVIEMESERSS